MTLPYRDFYYPLNVFVHILRHEEGDVPYLHYGLFERPDERIAVAQERSTEMILARLPVPPARILEVGIGLGTTMARLLGMGYIVEGITPDAKQIAMVAASHGKDFPARCVSFEEYDGTTTFDTIIFQESSQYIDSDALFRRARQVISARGSVIVLDEFSLQPMESPGALHSLAEFLNAARRHSFSLVEEIDVSAKAAPTIDYFMERIPRYHEALLADLGLTSEQVEDLITSGAQYRERYSSGVYGYRLLSFRG